jgi:hypothetical protein
MLAAILSGSGAIVLGIAMLRWPATFDKYLTARFASTPFMGGFAVFWGICVVLFGIFVDQTP